MIHNIFQIFSHTPVLVYFILGYLLFIGLRARKPRTISLYTQALFASIFLGISIHNLIGINNSKIYSAPLWLVCISIGGLIGWRIVRKWVLKFDREKKLVSLPGTWSTFIILMALFSTKYFVGVKTTLDPALKNHPPFCLTFLSIFACFTGIFLGRFLNYCHKLYKSENTSLLSKGNSR